MNDATATIKKEDVKSCPNGHRTVAFYHSHPSGDRNLSGAKGDKGVSEQTGIPVTVMAADGETITIYTPSDKEESKLPCEKEKK